MSEVLLKLRLPGGDWIIVYDDGRLDGAPQGTCIINRHPVIINTLLTQVEAEKRMVPDGVL